MMERYIDADALEKDLISRGFYPAIVKRAIEDAPTADVVSRIEFEAMRYAANSLKMHLEKAKQEAAREVFDLIDNAFSSVLVYNGYTVKEYLSFLKEKYMEEEQWNENRS